MWLNRRRVSFLAKKYLKVPNIPKYAYVLVVTCRKLKSEKYPITPTNPPPYFWSTMMSETLASIFCSGRVLEPWCRLRWRAAPPNWGVVQGIALWLWLLELVTSNRWQVTGDWWHMTCGPCHLCQVAFFSVSVLLSAPVKRLSVSCMQDLN